MIDTLRVEIEECIVNEYSRANKEHPAFASDHEGHDVLSEEVDESLLEMSRIQQSCEAMKVAIRLNDEKEVRKIALATYTTACHLAAEAVQVAAMARKIYASQELRSSSEWIQVPHLD